VLVLPRMRILVLAVLLLLNCPSRAIDQDPEWIKSLTTNKGPGRFNVLPAVHLTYRFGWSGLRAAHADIHFYFPSRNLIRLEVTGGTIGFPRSLFKVDVYHQSTANKATLRPIRFFQEEWYRNETIKTTVNFAETEVTGVREKMPSDHPAKPTVFKFSPVFDLETALLWVRSQPLQIGDTESLVVWASNAPYLATVKVVGKDTLEIQGERKRAIKLDLKLKRVDKSMQLKEHKLFKSGRGWLSDDNQRVPLRIEADIFIGYVFAELETMAID
jgi:hypothetical protein